MTLLLILVIGSISSFCFALGIGANDVGNSLASTVACRVIAVKHAMILSSVFEFLGAFSLSSFTSARILGLIDSECYVGEPGLYSLCFAVASISSALYVFGTTYFFSMPVSATHSVVGSMIGVAMATKGYTCVNWESLILITVFWVFSPVAAAIIAFHLYVMLRCILFKRDLKDIFSRAMSFMVICVFLVVGIWVLFIAFKLNDLMTGMIVALSCAVISSLLFYFLIAPKLMHMVQSSTDIFDDHGRLIELPHSKGHSRATSKNNNHNFDEITELEQNIHTKSHSKEHVALETLGDSKKHSELKESNSELTASDVKDYLTIETNTNYECVKCGGRDMYDVGSCETQALQRAIAELWKSRDRRHAAQEVVQTKRLFGYMQVLTVCTKSFAHGSNDLANASSTVVGMLGVYLVGSADIDINFGHYTIICGLGAIGIVIGLFLWGERILVTLGHKITPLTPVRGFCAEITSSFLVLVASMVGVPVSATHSTVGAIVGVGFIDGWANVRFDVVRNIVLSWIVTFPVSYIFAMVIVMIPISFEVKIGNS